MPRKPKFKWVLTKPCWELHFCPYGSLVEFYPLTSSAPIDLDARKAHYVRVLEEMKEGVRDEDHAWDFVQRLMYNDPTKWEEIAEYDTTGMNCNIFGHICPVFFAAYGVTETKERRRLPSRYIPREVMLKVVRRDGQICQRCHRNVPDNELHFDHIIPVSKGGPSTVGNLRVLCEGCNAEKSDSLAELLG